MKSRPKIEFHQSRMEALLEAQFSEDVDVLIAAMEKVGSNPLLLATIADCELRQAAFELKEDWGSPYGFMHTIRNYHLCRTWQWKLTLSDGPHELDLIGTKQFVSERIAPSPFTNLKSWLEGMQVAIILRDKSAVAVYSEADEEDFLDLSHVGSDSWESPYFLFLRLLLGADASKHDQLAKAQKAAMQASLDTDRAHYLNKIVIPTLELWDKALNNDGAQFNKVLYNQQVLRHEWHASIDGTTKPDILEFIDISALAAACHAQDTGIRVSVKSAYLPEFLVKRKFRPIEWPHPQWQKRKKS